MLFLLGILLILGGPMLIGLARSDNKAEKAKEYAAGTGLFLRIVGSIAAFFAGCFAGLVGWTKKKK